MHTHIFCSSVLAAALFAIGCGSNVETGSGGNGGQGTGGQSTGGQGTGAQGTGAASPCPAAEPSGGGVSCVGAPAGFRCTYGESVRPECRHDWTCSGGTWVTTKGFCLEPAPGTCLASEPAQGSTCNGTEGGVCTYGSDICICGSCTGGPCMIESVWTCSQPPTTSGCPAVVPNDGTTCSKPGLSCQYGFPCASSGTTAKCSPGGTWLWENEIACPL